ncbi:regulator of chromosome condensation 1/beta-lactamase-inhibitor protein II [Phlyctochytrium arcticum]|nr:regulator of chromosome condensation 1/beta-lactamase-inhibitor protein II [Phlyctochytrium arcticum]
MFAAVKKKDSSTLRSLLDSSTGGTNDRDASNGPSSAGASSYGRKNGFKVKKLLDPNERNEEGKTILHIAVAFGNEELVDTILACPRVNVNVQDSESGYTALHKAFYDGNVELAMRIIELREDCDLSIRDKEEKSCFDLLAASIEGSESGFETLLDEANPFEVEEEPAPDRDDPDLCVGDPATSLWTWGSNTNYILGHQNSDNRAFPERVDVMATYRADFQPIASLATLSEHEPTITDIHFSKYHCAVLANKQLFMNGFGAGGRLGQGNEETLLRPTLVRGIKGQIVAVALGTEHTVALTKKGNVWTWGSNQYGQLGYASEESARKHPCEMHPREVGGVFKKVRVMGAAASRHHTAVFTDAGGLYTWGLNVGQLGYTQPVNTIQLTPRKITDLAHHQFLQIAATKNATAVLTASHDVLVFSDFKMSRVNFAFQQFPKGMQVYRPRNHDPTPHISKLVAGNHQFAAMTSTGDVFLWSPPEPRFADTWQHTLFSQKRPKKVWAARKTHLAARDIGIGIDSSLIIRTESGHVYIGRRRPDLKQIKLSDKEVQYYKFDKIPYVQHITLVAASVSGAFGAVRVDPKPTMGALTLGTLRQDLAIANSVHRDPVDDDADIVFVTRDGCKIGAHKAILAARSPFFKTLFMGGGPPADLPLSITLSTTTPLSLSIALSSESIHLLLDFIYTGRMAQPWDHTVLVAKPRTSKEDRDQILLYKEVKAGITAFGLGDSQHVLYSYAAMKGIEGSDFLGILEL